MKTRFLISFLFTFLMGASVNAQWFKQSSYTTGNLNSVHCINDSTCYAVGELFNIRKTVDGGATPWFVPGGGTSNVDKSCVKMLNKDTILIAQANGTIRMTTTGSTSSTWSLDLPISPGGSNGMGYNDLAFNSKSNFIAVGGSASNTSSGGRLTAQSLTSGATWTQIGSGSGEPTIFGIENITSTKYVAVGGAKTIYRSTDAGVTWTKIKTGGVDTAFFDVHFPTKDTGYAVGGAFSAPSAGGIIFRTIDSGKTWTKPYTAALPALNTLYGVHFVDGKTGYAVGNGGVILVTTDAGASWVKQISPVSTDLNKIYFPSKNVGYIAGASGVILKTTDGGFIPALVVNPGSNKSVCPGFCATIGSTTIATGGTPPYTYSWSPVTNTNSSVVVCPTVNTTYTVIVTDVNNVTATSTVSVSIYTLAAVSFSGLPSSYCRNGGNLTLVGSPSGGTFSGSGITGTSLNPLVAGTGTHTVSYTYTDTHGCVQTTSTKSVTITAIPAKTNICMVTVDSVNSSSNIVVWEKPVLNSINKFNIYRKNSFGVLTYIAATSYTASPVYTDMSATPNSKSSSYAVSIVDTCGVESSLSDTNSTIFAYISEFSTPNTFVVKWTDYIGFKPTEYEVWRKDNTVSNWAKIATVPDSAANMHADAASPPNTSRYKIRAINPSSTRCLYSTFSNSTADYTGIKEIPLDHLLNVYPNPNHGSFTFQLTGIKYRTAGVKLFDMFGKLVYESTVKNQKAEIAIPGFTPGIYQLQVITDMGTANKKIIVQ